MLDMQDTLGISEHILTKYFSDNIKVRYWMNCFSDFSKPVISVRHYVKCPG